jgi:hypothetical protein
MAKKIETVNSGTGLDAKGYNKTESWNEKNIKDLSALYYKVLGLIGEDPDREGLKGTPVRVAKALYFLTSGYNMNPCQIINSAKFKEEYQQMVLVKDIDLYSMCEHHMLPFFGKAHVAYYRAQQDRQGCRCFQQKAAGSGETHNADPRLYPGVPQSGRCGSCD